MKFEYFFGKELVGMKLLESELKVLSVLWQEGEMPASVLYRILAEKVGWNKNTTYTVLKKSIEKGLIERQEPNFICKPLKTREEMGIQSANDIVNKMFEKSPALFLNAFLGSTKLSEKEIEEAKKLLDNM